jgi:hypothetical protein
VKVLWYENAGYHAWLTSSGWSHESAQVGAGIGGGGGIGVGNLVGGVHVFYTLTFKFPLVPTHGIYLSSSFRANSQWK